MSYQSEVLIIDYGIGNLLSVRRGLEYCGATVTVTSDPDVIYSSPRVILPGVGAFANGMAELKARGLDVALREVAARGTPLLGICLGMQMLLDVSEEFEDTAGLGLISGRVVHVPPFDCAGDAKKIPHIGWNALCLPDNREDWHGTVLNDIRPGDSVYFVHSYMATPKDPTHRVADCLYGGTPISAAIASGNVSGCQFHPEKSGQIGLQVLKRFLSV
jgi:glutamine amidotransferase